MELKTGMTMRRSLLTLFVLAILAAWAGAQGTSSSLPAAAQARLFHMNRTLLEDLVDRGIGLAEADHPLQRADECRKTASSLANYIQKAADDQDADRVVELASLMGDVVREGLVPNLDKAQQDIRPGDPREAQLAKVRDGAARELDGLPAKIPSDGKLADNPKVKEAIASLLSLKSQVKK